jgi:hypothetical protein
MNSSGSLPRPWNAPPGVQVPPGVQPGAPEVILARYVIVFGTNGGVFLYSGKPALGNPPILWDSLATKDPFGNMITPGMFLAQTASSGKAKGGLTWNTATPGTAEAVLALFPNATVAFTGDSPFVLGRVFNRGAVNELLALALGGGGTAGSSPVQMEIFSQSKDGTILGHVSFFDWASTNLICDININGIVAADPNSANTLETWHQLAIAGTAGLTAGSPTPKFKLYPDNTVAFAGEVNATSGTTGGTFATLAAGTPYRPISTKKFAVPVSAGTPPAAANPQVTIASTGVMTLSAGPTAAAYSFALDCIRYPLDY